MDQILGVKDAAKACDVTPATIRNWDRNGKLPAERTPSGVRIFRKVEVDRVAAEMAHTKRAKGEAHDAEL